MMSIDDVQSNKTILFNKVIGNGLLVKILISPYMNFSWFVKQAGKAFIR